MSKVSVLINSSGDAHNGLMEEKKCQNNEYSESCANRHHRLHPLASSTDDQLSDLWKVGPLWKSCSVWLVWSLMRCQREGLSSFYPLTLKRLPNFWGPYWSNNLSLYGPSFLLCRSPYSCRTTDLTFTAVVRTCQNQEASDRLWLVSFITRSEEADASLIVGSSSSILSRSRLE